MYKLFIVRGLQALVCLDIIVYIDIRCVPDIVSAARILTEALDNLPIVVIVKFIAVSPQIEHLRIAVSVRNLNKALDKLHKPWVIVMAGGVKLQPDFGEIEILRGPYGP